MQRLMQRRLDRLEQRLPPASWAPDLSALSDGELEELLRFGALAGVGDDGPGDLSLLTPAQRERLDALATKADRASSSLVRGGETGRRVTGRSG